MSELDKLLQGVEVEWKTLGEVADYIRGLVYNKTNESGDNTGYKVIRANNITLSRHTINFDDVKHIKSDTKVKESQKLFKNDILISAASGSREHVGKVAYIFEDLNYYFGGFMGVVRCSEHINPRFLFHILTSGLFQKYLDEMLNTSTINNLSSSVMNEFKIPIPSLPIQKEIARILDTFTKLTEELTAELTARKKQYSYYRDQLLRFAEGEVEWKALGEVGELVRGNGLPKADFTETGVPAIHYGQIYTYYKTFTTETKSFVSPETATKLKKVNTGDVVITNTSENLEDVGKAVVYLGKIQAVTGGHATIFKPSKDISGKYFAYFTQSEGFASQKRKFAKGTKVIDVSATDMSKIKIPIPSLEEQEHIVSILDKFDTLTTSISEGLPKEIALRKQQYEYYRGKLLTFPQKEEA